MSIKERISEVFHNRPWVFRVGRVRVESTIGPYLGEILGFKVGLLEFSKQSKTFTVCHLHLWVFGVALWIGLE